MNDFVRRNGLYSLIVPGYKLNIKSYILSHLNRTKSEPERLEKINAALAVNNELVDIQIKEAQDQLAVVALQLVSRPKSNKLLDEEAKIIAKLSNLESQRYSQTKRLETQRTSIEEEMANQSLRRLRNSPEKRLRDKRIMKSYLLN